MHIEVHRTKGGVVSVIHEGKHQKRSVFVNLCGQRGATREHKFKLKETKQIAERAVEAYIEVKSIGEVSFEPIMCGLKEKTDTRLEVQTKRHINSKEVVKMQRGVNDLYERKKH